MANMVTMYDCFIPPDCRPHYLPPLTVVSSTTSTAHTPAPTPTPSISSISGRQRKRKQKKCSTEGCDGSGHPKKKKNEQDGLKVTQQKPDVLGVSKSLAFIFHASAHFTSLPNILTSSFALLSLPDTICPQTADQGTTPLVTCWAGTVPDRHSPKLVLLYAGLLYYYSYGHIIQAVCMRAVQWLYNGCIYVCCG